MRAVYSDPDFTGYILPSGSAPAWWVLTRDQWYVITRIFVREAVRAHYARVDAGNADLTDQDLQFAAASVKYRLMVMRADPRWNVVQWGTRVPWPTIACNAYWTGLGAIPGALPPPAWESWLSAGSCPAFVYQDYAYQSGVLALNADLDVVQQYEDPANSARYEQMCDAIFAEVFGGYALGAQQQGPTYNAAEGAGTAYVETPPEARTGVASSPVGTALGFVVGAVLGYAGSTFLGAGRWTGAACGLGVAILGGVVGSSLDEER